MSPIGVRTNVIVVVFAILVAGCAEPVEIDSTSSAVTGELKGYATSSGASDLNRCVPDIEGQFDRLRQRGDILGFNMGAGFPYPDEDQNHWQGGGAGCL